MYVTMSRKLSKGQIICQKNNQNTNNLLFEKCAICQTTDFWVSEHNFYILFFIQTKLRTTAQYKNT